MDVYMLVAMIGYLSIYTGYLMNNIKKKSIMYSASTITFLINSIYALIIPFESDICSSNIVLFGASCILSIIPMVFLIKLYKKTTTQRGKP